MNERLSQQPVFTLEGAIELAKSRHQDKPDKDGNGPYYLHALRVMEVAGMPELGPDVHARQMAGVLHDIVEHDGLTPEELTAMGAPGEIVEAIDILTEKPGQSPEDHLAGVKGNPLTKPIKLVDNRDNKKGKMLGVDSEEERQALAARYDRELEELVAGDPRLAAVVPEIEARLEAIYREGQSAGN